MQCLHPSINKISSASSPNVIDTILFYLDYVYVIQKGLNGQLIKILSEPRDWAKYCKPAAYLPRCRNHPDFRNTLKLRNSDQIRPLITG